MSQRVPPLLFLLLTSAAAAPQGMDFGGVVLRAADANGDGELARAEWDAFCAGAVEGASVSAVRLQARVMASFLDGDGDGRVSRPELVERLGGEASGFGDFGGAFAREMADVDGDGAASEAERAALLESLGAAEALSEDVLTAWVEEVARRGRGDRSAMTPAVVLTSIAAALDATRNAKLEPDDLERLFARADQDGDGTLRADELRPRRRGQDGEGAPRGDLEAQRKKPVLMPWQRTLEDALAVSKARNQPILVCVNMDGESASESLVWYRYRDPEFASLASGFVCLIVSPDVHAPRSHDDRGRRVTDPRLGSVLDREHVDIEPALFERWFGGQRVAPRHVGISPAGEILFDLYLLGDLGEIDAALREHGVAVMETMEMPDVPTLLGRPDARWRVELERRAVEGEWRERFELAAGALATSRGVQHPELVRLALRDPDARVRRQVLWTVARELRSLELGLWDEALRVAHGEGELRGVLRASLARLARDGGDAALAGEAARRLAAQTGLAAESLVLDVDAWLAALEGAGARLEEASTAEQLDALSEEAAELEAASAGAPEDAELRTQQARVLLRLSEALLASGQDPSYALGDARVAAEAALERGADDGAAAAVAAVASRQLSEPERVGWYAARAFPALREREPSGLLAAQALRALAYSSTGAIYTALAESRACEASDVADAWAAWRVLLAHPGGRQADAEAALTFLESLGARSEQAEFARRAVERFPDASTLHLWLRSQVLRDEGGAALELRYADLARARGGDAAFRWFHGVALLSAAEARVVNGETAAALASYAFAAERLRSSFAEKPDFEDSAQHYVALALAGAARLHLESGDLDAALRDAAAALAARPASAEVADGLGQTPRQTADRVARALRAAGREADAEILR
jgi:hypothetical protein